MEPGEREDPEIPHHLGVHQQTPPGSVLLVIPVSELIPAARNWGGGKNSFISAVGNSLQSRKMDWVGSFGIKCPNTSTTKELGGVSAGVAGKE